MTEQPGGWRAHRSQPVAGQARRAVASFPSYQAAEQAVDVLSDQGFPVRRVAIVGRELHTVEQVTGRMGYARAALRGAVQGGLLGLLFGWLFGLFNWIDPLVTSLTLAIYGLLWGVLIGALLGLVVHAMSAGRRDFASAGARVWASQYDVMVDDEVADEAARILGRRSR
jgi:heat induced stress protein YflT